MIVFIWFVKFILNLFCVCVKYDVCGLDVLGLIGVIGIDFEVCIVDVVGMCIYEDLIVVILYYGLLLLVVL